MSTETTQSGLSAAEDAYFESGGNTPLAPETTTETVTEPVKAEPAKVETEAVQTDAEKQENRDEKGRYAPTVPHTVFHAEREERKRIAAERDELRSFKAAVEERQRWAKEAEQQPKITEMPGEDDPLGRLEWLTARENERLEAAKKAQEEEEHTSAANAEWNRNYQSVETAYNAASAADPTLDEAFIYVRDSYAKELRAQGFNDREVQHYVNQHGIQFVNTIAGRNLDPAKFVKELAESRGWTGPKKADPVTTAADAIKKVADAQSASRTVAQAGSAAGGDETTLEGIMAMSRADFDVWHSDPKNARLFTKLLG